MNLHVVRWDEDCALWRTRVLQNVNPKEPFVQIPRGNQPWLAWNTPDCRNGLAEYVELESVAAWISSEGDILLFYRPAPEYWRNINPSATRRVKWLEREWPTFGEVALEELAAIAQAISQESGQLSAVSSQREGNPEN
jgi:hypothetical protein